MSTTKEPQSIEEFTAELDRQTRRFFRMGVEKWKIASNTIVAYLIYRIGESNNLDPMVTIGIILIVGAPHAAELLLGNGIGPDWLKPDYEGSNDDE